MTRPATDSPNDIRVQSPLDTVRALLRALERGETGDQLRQYFTEDVRQVEYPSLVGPRLSERGLAEMLAGSVAGAGLLHHQRYAEEEAVEHRDRVVLRLTWSAVLSIPLATLQPGDVLTAHVAMFCTVRDGRIAHQASYDCYEPFASENA